MWPQNKKVPYKILTSPFLQIRMLSSAAFSSVCDQFVGIQNNISLQRYVTHIAFSV